MSSTAVTFTFARLSRKEPEESGALAVGAIGASTLLLIRVLTATAILNPGLARAAVPYFVLPFLAGAVATVAGFRRNGNDAAKQEIVNPLQFWGSIQLALMFQLVLYGVGWLSGTFGSQGLLVSGAVLGLTDMDALTISMARSVQVIDWETAARALAIGVLSNTLLKTAAALALGSGRFRWLVTGGLAAMGTAMVLSLFVL